MTEAVYLYIATNLGLSRFDAMQMEISTVLEMADVRAEAMKEAKERSGR